MNIFESLESLNVSEKCFDDIMSIVEEILNEDTESYAEKKAAQLKGKRDDSAYRVYGSKYNPETVKRHEGAYNKAFQNTNKRIDKFETLAGKARKAKEAGIEAVAKKEQERIKKNETRKDIHPSVLNKQKQREEDIKKVAGQEDSIGRKNWDDDRKESEVKASSIAHARAQGVENKNGIGQEKTHSKKNPSYWQTSHRYNSEWGGDYPSYIARYNSREKDEDDFDNAEDRRNWTKRGSIPKGKNEENDYNVPSEYRADYQKAKNTATKALKGHNKSSVKWRDNELNSDKLYRLGKK